MGYNEVDKDEEEKEGVEEDEDGKQDEDENDGKEPGTIGQGETVDTLADNVDNMVDDQLILLPEQGLELRKHTPRQQPPAPAERPQSLGHCP